MKCDVKIEFNRKNLDILHRAKKIALYKTAEAIKNDIASRQVVPMDKSKLENSGSVDDSLIDEMVACVVYDTPYARRWYFNAENVNFQKTKNPNAQDHWMDYYLDGEGKQWVIETYTTFLKQESKGIIK